MPTSFFGQISTIMYEIALLHPQSVLDIGVGFGKYGVLCRELLDVPYQRYHKETWKVRIDGIEGFEEYRNPLHGFVYDHMYYSLIEDTFDRLEVVYDLGLMIDVLEHFEKETGAEILRKGLNRCKALLVSVPEAPEPQSYLGNDLEQHRSVWTMYDFIGYKMQKIKTVPLGRGNGNIIVLAGEGQ